MDKQILQICSCEYEYFFNKSNVQGIALGYKIKNGFYTCEKCIKVYVSKKIALNRLYDNELVPKYYKGIKTDLEEVGEFEEFSLRNRVRPVTGGYNIGPVDTIRGGSMGCLVTDGKYYYILGNNHVLARNGEIPLGTNVIQPSVKWGGHAPEDIIGTLSKYVQIRFSTLFHKPENFVDCAMALITKRSGVSTKINFLGRIKGTTIPVLAQDVQKVGSTTELTKGKVTGVGSTCRMKILKKECLYKNQILTNVMSQKGDSGSILLDKNINAMGLLMGGSSSKDIFNPIGMVLSALNVSIVTGK